MLTALLLVGVPMAILTLAAWRHCRRCHHRRGVCLRELARRVEAGDAEILETIVTALRHRKKRGAAP